MASPIVHGTALVPLLRFPRGAALTIRVVMDSEISLTTHTARFAVRSRFGQTRPVFIATEPGDAFSKSGQTLNLTLAPEAIDETTDSELTLADLQEQGENAYRIDFLDADEALAVRLQGNLDWLAEEGAWEDEPTSTITLPEITVSIVAGAVTVSVALITGGASVDNETVNAALAENAAASRTALGLGTAATQDSSAFAGASHTQAISTVTGLQTALDGKLATTLKGASNGLAELDSGGLVPSSQLPSYVDDVIEAANYAALPGTGTSGKIYVTLDDGKTYRWSGSAYVEISASLALGETSSTAYRGDRGKDAYDLAQTAMQSVTTGITGANRITNAVSLTQAAYDALGSKNASTWYVIVG